jgi:uncharacterized protein involved in outer membrane biogenesis
VRALQIIKKVLIYSLATVVAIAATLYVVLRYYEDDVVTYAFEKSKDVFTRPVNVGDIDLAFWHTFPNASLHLSDVFIPDAFDEADTLLQAEDIYLEFNLFDLFRKKYELLEMEVDAATTKIKYNKKGEDNYHFWKPSDDTTGFSVALEEVLLTDVRFYYRDESTQKVVDVYTAKTKAGGDLTQAKCELKVESDSFIRSLWSNGTTLWQQQNIGCEATIQAQFDEKHFLFQRAELEWGDVVVYVDGVIQTKNDSYFDLTINSDGLSLGQLTSLLPEHQKANVKRYSPTGEVDISASYKGTLSKKSSPKLYAQFNLRNGTMDAPNGEVELSDIAIQSTIQSEADGWRIDISNCGAGLAGGRFQGNGSIHAGQQTKVDLNVSAQVDAADLKHFFSLDTLEVCNGLIQLELQSKGELRMAPGDSLLDITALHNTGQANWNNGEMKLKNSNRLFTGIQAAFQLDNADAHVKGLNGVVNGSDFSINGSFKNLIPFLLDDNQRLLIEASLYSRMMDFNQLLETNQGSGEAYRLTMPKRIDFSFQSHVSRFVFRQFYADDIRCVAHLQNGRFFIDPLTLKTAGGMLNAQLSLDETNSDQYFVNCLANVKDMNIQELFREFENFDQTFIQERHLRGKADAMVQFQAPLSSALEVRYRDLYSVIDLKIAEGQLIGLESLQEVAVYLKSNKWIAPFVDEDRFAEKLKDIRFSTLENTIEIKDEVIDIPVMDIHSSAMDISISGQHRFNNQINYTIGFNLRDILLRRQKEWQEQDDGLGKQLFIFMRGTTEHPEFGLDKDAARSDRKAEMENEKQNVKALLKEEFGLFKKDNQVGTFQEKTQPKETTTTIEWEGFDPEQEKPKEQETPVKPKKETSPPADTKKKKTPKWLQEKD